MIANLWLSEIAVREGCVSHNFWNDYVVFCQCFEDMVL